MDVTLFEFSKKENSVARPNTSGYTVTGVLKAPVSVLSPVITFANDGIDLIKNYNYAYILEFGRYYWITGKEVNHTGLTTISFVIDPLGTYKNEIGNITAYVTRSASAYNGNYADGAYKTYGAPEISFTKLTNWSPATDLVHGCMIIGTASDLATTGIQYWYMGLANFANLVDALSNNTTLATLMGRTVDNNGVCTDLAGAVQGITADMYVSMYNPLQNIKSIVFYPIEPVIIKQGNAQNFKLGDVVFPNVYAHALADLSFYGTYGYTAESSSITVNIPKHPQYESRGAYLLQPPYSQYNFSVAGFGTFDIDPAKLVGVTTLYFQIVTDLKDGSAVLYIDSNKTNTGRIAQIHGNAGMTWTISQRSADLSVNSFLTGAALSTANVIADRLQNGFGSGGSSEPMGANIPAFGSYAMSTENVNAVASAYSNMGENIKDTFSDIISGIRLISNLSSAGSIGTFAEFLAESFCQAIFYRIAPERLEDIGRPLNEERQLNTLTGFCMCQNAHFLNSKATKTEIDFINGALSSGIILDWS